MSTCSIKENATEGDLSKGAQERKRYREFDRKFESTDQMHDIMDLERGEE